jgi:hypothetical protein
MRNNHIFWPNFSLAVMRAQCDNGDGAAMLRAIRFQYVGVCISTGLAFIPQYSWPYGYSTACHAKFGVRRNFRNVTDAQVGQSETLRLPGIRFQRVPRQHCAPAPLLRYERDVQPTPRNTVLQSDVHMQIYYLQNKYRQKRSTSIHQTVVQFNTEYTHNS